MGIQIQMTYSFHKRCLQPLCHAWDSPSQGLSSLSLFSMGLGQQPVFWAWAPQVSLELTFSSLPSLVDLSQPDKLCTGKTSIWTWACVGNQNSFCSDEATKARSSQFGSCALEGF